MTIDISIYSLAVFWIQTVGFIGVSAVMAIFFYYTDDPTRKPSKIRHTIFGLVVGIAFVLCYGIVKINWLP